MQAFANAILKIFIFLVFRSKFAATSLLLRYWLAILQTNSLYIAT